MEDNNLYLDLLPNDILIYHLFPKLDVLDIYKMSHTSTRFRDISQNKIMWDIKSKIDTLIPIYFYDKFVGMVDYTNIEYRNKITLNLTNLINHMKYYGYNQNDILTLVPHIFEPNEIIINMRYTLNYFSYDNRFNIRDVKNMFIFKDMSRNSIHYVYRKPFIIKHIEVEKKSTKVKYKGSGYVLPADNRLLIFDEKYEKYEGSAYVVPVDNQLLIFDENKCPLYYHKKSMQYETVKMSTVKFNKDYII